MGKMKFKDLSDKNIEKIKKIFSSKELSWDERMSRMEEITGVSERATRKWLVKLGISKTPTINSPQYEDAKKRKHDKTKTRFLITWGQNATKIHTGFWNNLKAYADYIDAEILVIPGRYHNFTGVMDDKDKYDSQEWWDAEIVPYLTRNRHNLNKGISVLSDVPVQPTASNPLNSLESLTVGESGIVGHPRVHLKTLPVLDSSNPRFLMSTGACTNKNFSASKAGLIGSFHHTLGAVVVELKNRNEFFIRQITAEEKSGDFIDLYHDVKGGSVSIVDECLALVKGDIHYGNHDVNVIKSSFKTLIPKINPREIILHDVFDGYSINHHEEKNFVKQYENDKTGKNSLKAEIDALLDWLDTIKHHNLVVVFSNHDDFLTRFIINGDPKRNVKNALEYMLYGQILLEGKADKGLIPYVINERFKKIKCLGRNDSYKIGGWELGIHGMDGVNGSRGGIQQYKRLNSKVITAHAHSPARFDGALQVGTNTALRMGYNNGISTWSHSDVIIHKNYKAQHIFFDSNGDFTTF
jgi:hypothetical protein